MVKLLSLDIGSRHTGVACADSEIAVAMPLDTIHHTSEKELIDDLKDLVGIRKITTIVIGIPLFMSGDESEQTRFTKYVADLIKDACSQCSIEFIDERGTSNVSPLQKSQDPHAQAATTLMQVFLERRQP